MSHFTRVRTQMVDAEFLKAALRDLGYEPREATEGNERAASVRGFGGSREQADIKVATRNKGFDIGFKKSQEPGGRYELVADWWGIHDVKQDELVAQLTQRYAYHAAKAKLAEQGFSLVQEEQQVGGRIHLVLRRMV
jgi:hypothetical protein